LVLLFYVDLLKIEYVIRRFFYVTIIHFIARFILIFERVLLIFLLHLW